MKLPKTFPNLWQCLYCGVIAILILVTFHALFTTWLGSTFVHLDTFRIWKELLLALMIPLALWLVYRDEHLRSWFVHDKLVLLVLLYVLLHIGLGAIALQRGQVNANALIYGLLINTRFLLFMLLCALVAAKTALIKRWPRLLLWPAAIVIGFGLLQLFILPVTFLERFGYGSDTIPAVQTVDQKLEYRRIQSSLRGANPLGAYLVLVVTALVALLFASRGEISNQQSTENRKQETGNRKQAASFRFITSKLPPSTFHLPMAVAAVALLFFTYSRSAYLGTMASLGLLALWTVWQSRFRRWAVVGMAIGIVLLGSMVWLLRDNDRLQNTLFHSDEHSRSSESSNAGRLRALNHGMQSVIDDPLGDGPGSAGPASVRNNRQARIAENYYIQIAQEVGLLGGLLFIAINGLVARRLWRERRELLGLCLLTSLAGITLINLLSHAWADDTLAYIWWGLAGIALAPVAFRQGHKVSTAKSTVKKRRGASHGADLAG